MAGQRSRVILISREDAIWVHACETAFGELGLKSVEAYNCWSAETAHKLSGGQAIVIDGHILCGFVSAERPGPVLALSPKVPVVIFNAQELNEDQRVAAMAHNAAVIEGQDIAEISRCVERVLPQGE